MWLCNWTVNRDWKNFEEHDRILEQNISRNTDIKDSAGEDLEKKEEHVTGN